MRTKNILKKLSLGCLTLLSASLIATGANVSFATATAEETESSSVVTNLFTPTETDTGYTVNSLSSWGTTAVEAYADAPSGMVIHSEIDYTYTESSSGIWPSIVIDLPYEGDTTDFAGYVTWVEYSGKVYSDTDYWSIYQFLANGKVITKNAPITFIDSNGKIDETTSGGYQHHRNNMIELEDKNGYTHAYEFNFKGYVVMPMDSFNSTDGLAPNASGTMKYSWDYRNVFDIDLKIGDIGFYTDYDAVLNEYGRCNYEFVDQDGTVVKSGTVKPNSTVEAPEYENVFTKNGMVYEFIGWSNYTEGMTITTDVTFNASYKVRDFQMVDGASIRTNEGSSGIRFIAEFDENVYNEVTASENMQFGMIVTKYDYYKSALKTDEDLVTGLNSLGGKKYVLITESSTNPLKPYKTVTETDVRYRINGAITNISYDHADWKWIGVGVIITTTDEGTEYLYCAFEEENVARTASYVASAALDSTTETFDDIEKATLKNYVYKTAAKLTEVSEADYTAATDKSVYLDGFYLEMNGGLDTSNKFNQNLEGKEAYLEINATKDLSATVQNAAGAILDVTYSISVGNTDVLSLDGASLTALKNGYSTLTTCSSLFGFSEEIMVYTGSELSGNKGDVKFATNEGAGGTNNADGEIDGKTYRYTQWDSDDGQSLYGAYSNEYSVYWIDYLLSQGYKYLRIPFYFDTTKYAEFTVTESTTDEDGNTVTTTRSATAAEVSSPYFTIWMAKQIDGTSGGSYKKVYVPENEWCYYDMDLRHYRATFALADESGIDTYGIKTSHGSWYQYLIMKFSCKYGYLHTGDHIFIKESTIEIDQSNDSVSFGDTVTFSDYYATKEAVKYTVDGVETDSIVALNATHNVTISANVYTANIGDGTYTIGNKDSWTINACGEFADVAKTLTVNGAPEDGSDVLIDVVNGADVTTSAYTGANVLSGLENFEVSESYVKKYSDQSVVNSTTISASERGIFYATVSATNGVQSVKYTLNLDLYSSSEPIEYESFGRADSSYAVKAWYYLNGALNKSYDYLVSNYTEESKSGMPITVGDGYASLMHYGDLSNDNSDNVKNAYGYDSADSIYYFAIDQSKIQPDNPLVHVVGNSTTAINVYVLPRHTKGYYEYFAKDNTDLLQYAWAAGWSYGQSKRYNILEIVSATTATVQYKDHWSANWQYFGGHSMTQTITLSTIAQYYDSLCNYVYPFYISEDPHGRTSTDLNNGVMKLSSLLF